MTTRAKSMNANPTIDNKTGACLSDESPCKLSITEGKVKRRKRGNMSNKSEKGNNHSPKELLKNLYPIAYNVAKYKFGDAISHHDAEEIALDIIREVVFANEGLPLDKLGKLIIKSSKNKSIDRLRNANAQMRDCRKTDSIEESKDRKDDEKKISLEPPDLNPIPNEQVEHNEKIELVNDFINKLPKREHDVIRCKFILDLTRKEAAKKLGMTESNYGVILHRTLKQLPLEYTKNHSGTLRDFK